MYKLSPLLDKTASQYKPYYVNNKDINRKRTNINSKRGLTVQICYKVIKLSHGYVTDFYLNVFIIVSIIIHSIIIYPDAYHLRYWYVYLSMKFI